MNEKKLSKKRRVADHRRVSELFDHIRGLDGSDVPSWPDGSKLRMVALTMYLDDVRNGRCVHNDGLQRDLLVMADRLDAYDLLEAGVGDA